MSRFLLQLLRRPALRFGLARDEGHGRLRDPRFVSFIAQSNRKQIDTDFHDLVLAGRKLCRRGLLALIALGGAWVVVESAKALSVF